MTCSEYISSKRARIAKEVLSALKTRYPQPPKTLNAESPWQILVATVLAAQCTDERVNGLTPNLFGRWPKPEDLLQVSASVLEEAIRPTGFFRNKAKNLLGAARRICEVYKGQVPQTIEDLLTLPGVARKTANVVLFHAYGLNEGLAVDTHVRRISYRLGLTDAINPVEIEQDLIQLFPREEWGYVNQRMVWFGREVCKARSPQCKCCELKTVCSQREMPRLHTGSIPKKQGRPHHEPNSKNPRS